MSLRNPCTWLGLLTALASFSTPSLALAVTSGSNGSHDPSRMVESNGQVWIYSTGGGSKSSPDGLVYASGPGIFPNGTPAWLQQRFPKTRGTWAPDLIRAKNKYLLYYSVAQADPNRSCLIGLVSSPTLDPKQAGFAWKDEGLVVSNNESVNYAAIDAAPFYDKDNNLWLVWGGGYANPDSADAIWVTRLDNDSGLPSAADTAKPGHPVLKGHKEGPYIHYRDNYYYIFWQTGSCCSGTSSTYQINMARSSSVTGPYTGERVFYKSNGNVHGPGHIGIYSRCGQERFTYHYYPTGQSIVGMNEMTWEGGWPVAGDMATTPLKLCGDDGTGTPGPGSGSGGTGAGGTTGAGGAGTGGGGGAGDGGGLGVAGAAAGSGGSLNGGAASTGGSGAVSSGAASGSAGTFGTGGSGTGTGPLGSGGVSTAGAAGGAGTSNAGAGGSSPSDSGDSESEGCTVAWPGRAGSSGSFALLLAAVGAAWLTARRRRG